jgi:hypothetical protein
VLDDDAAVGQPHVEPERRPLRRDDLIRDPEVEPGRADAGDECGDQLSAGNPVRVARRVAVPVLDPLGVGRIERRPAVGVAGLDRGAKRLELERGRDRYLPGAVLPARYSFGA